MKKRIKLKKHHKFNKFIIILILLIIFIFLSFKFINLKVNPVLLDYAEMESRKLASIIINDAINQNVAKSNIDDMFIITKEGDEIKSIDFNPITVNKILTETTSLIQNNLKFLEQGKIELLNLTTNALVDYNQNK